MNRNTRTQLVAAGVLSGCLVGSGVLATQLRASVGVNKLGYAETAEEGTPKQVALGIAMGAFRGVLVNFLWIRANALKEAGRYYEAYDLAKTITTLQPRFPHVWAFHAWNMAYNISVTTQTVEERWSWVRDGIRLLRDQGIPANPNDLLVHKELAWIYLHKVQGYTDEANVFYKQKVALEWSEILGPPPPEAAYSIDRDEAIAAYVAWLTPIERAPDTMAELIERTPLVKTLVDRLKAETTLVPGRELLRYYEVHRMMATTGQRGMYQKRVGANFRALASLADDPDFAAAWADLVPFLQRQVIVGELHMEPDRMIRYTKKYGPLDWRHAAAHATYWSARGVEQALGRVSESNKDDYDFINVDRLTMQALQELYRTGLVSFDAFTGDYVAMPNTHFVRSYGDALGDVVSRSWADRKKRVYSFYSAGYENFLTDAIRLFFRRGQKSEAAYWYDKLGTFPGQNLNDWQRAYKFSLPLDQFVEEDLFERLTSPSVAVMEVSASITGAFQSLLGGDTAGYNSQIEYAKRFHRYYMERQLRETLTSQDEGRMEQMSRDFAEVQAGVFIQFISILNPDDAEVLYARVPTTLQLYAYDALQSRLRAAMDGAKAEGGRGFDDAFASPEGIEEFRLLMAQRLEEAKRQQPAVDEK